MKPPLDVTYYSTACTGTAYWPGWWRMVFIPRDPFSEAALKLRKARLAREVS